MDSKRSALWFAVFTSLVLLAGAAAGVLVDRHFIRPRPAGPRFSGLVDGGMRPGMMPGRGGPGQPGMLMPRLVRALNLTTAQADGLKKILEQRRERIEKVRGEMREKMDAEQRGLHDEIRGILQPDQRKRFDELIAARPGPWPGTRGEGPDGRGRGMPGGRGDGRGGW